MVMISAAALCAPAVLWPPRDQRVDELGHRFPRDIILLAVQSYLQLGAAAERIGLPMERMSTEGSAVC